MRGIILSTVPSFYYFGSSNSVIPSEEIGITLKRYLLEIYYASFSYHHLVVLNNMINSWQFKPCDLN